MTDETKWSRVREWDDTLTRVEERAKAGKPTDRWITAEEHYPLLCAALFWRRTAKDLSEIILEADRRVEENMGTVDSAKKNSG